MTNTNSYLYQRSFQGIWIPAKLYYNEKLTWLEKILLLEIQSSDYEEDNNGVSISPLIDSVDFNYLSDLLDISKEVLINMINHLIRSGYIVEYINNSFSINLNPKQR